MKTNLKTPKTEKQIQKEENLNKIWLTHAVSCMQQLELLKFRLISFEDLSNGIKLSFDQTKKLLSEYDKSE